MSRHRLGLGGRVHPVVGTFKHDRGHRDLGLSCQPTLRGFQGRVAGNRSNPVAIGMEHHLDEIRVVEGGCRAGESRLVKTPAWHGRTQAATGGCPGMRRAHLEIHGGLCSSGTPGGISARGRNREGVEQQIGGQVAADQEQQVDQPFLAEGGHCLLIEGLIYLVLRDESAREVVSQPFLHRQGSAAKKKARPTTPNASLALCVQGSVVWCAALTPSPRASSVTWTPSSSSSSLTTYASSTQHRLEHYRLTVQFTGDCTCLKTIAGPNAQMNRCIASLA